MKTDTCHPVYIFLGDWASQDSRKKSQLFCWLKEQRDLLIPPKRLEEIVLKD
jgi:hypothetical protein